MKKDMKRESQHTGAKAKQARTNFWPTTKRRLGHPKTNSNLFRSTLSVAFLSLLLVGCGGSGGNANNPQTATPTFEIDQALEPAVETITFIDGTGSRSVASISDDKGNQADFVEDEVIVALDDPSKLSALLTRLNAVVLKEIGPPAIVGIPADFPTFYLLRIDPATASPTELADLIADRGGESDADHRISSQRGLDMLAAIAREEESVGTQLGANFLLTYESDGSDLSRRAMIESPTATGGAGYTQDAFQWPYMDRGSLQDIGAAEAARLVHDAGRIPAPGNEIRFLIIDAGFSSGADYASPVLPGASALDTPNPYNCSGNPCPWHGTAVASTALSIFNDGLGGAGPAAEVARPIFMQSPTPNFWDIFEYIFETIPAAIGTLPDIINISASVDIPSGACLTGACAALDTIGLGLHGAGISVFTSAGNNGALDIDAEDCFIFGCWESGYIAPCEMPGVTCVGGMAHASRDKHPDSSWGSKQHESNGSVDIYAPYSVWVHDDPDGGSTNAIFVSGTSFSSPFVASIAALIKAANPSLNAAGVWAIMRDNAHTEGGEGVHRWVNAYGAVRAALGGNAPPFAQITSPSEGAEYSLRAAYASLFCAVEDDGDAADLSFAWSSSLDGAIGGTSASSNSGPLFSLGVHEITCTVTDGPYTVSDTISINVVNDPPNITITSPPASAEFFTGQAIALTSTPTDINDNLADVTWEVRAASTTVWSGSGVNTTIPAGTLSSMSYTLIATATDTEGESGTSVIALQINPDPADIPPSITNLVISAVPADDPYDNPPAYYYVDPCTIDVNGAEPGNGWCQRLDFSAMVTDDNPLPNTGSPFYFPIGITWDVYESGRLVSSFNGGTENTYDLVAGSYRVVLTVVDSGGYATSVEWRFDVRLLA